MNATWTKIVLFVITDRDNKIPDFESVAYVISDVKNMTIFLGTILEVVYWYHLTPKDGVHSITAPTNTFYLYEVEVSIRFLWWFEHETYKGDILLVGTQPNKCPSKWKTVKVTKLISEMWMWVHCYVRDLCPFPGVLSPVEDKNNTTSSDKELYADNWIWRRPHNWRRP